MAKNKSKKRGERKVEESSFPVKNCRMMNICQLLKILTRRKLTAIKWLQTIGLLDNESCCDNCGKRMSLVLRSGASGVRSDKYEWECTKCRMFTKSLRDGTLFQSSKLPLQKLTMIIYFWAHNFPSHVAERELSLSERTVNRWYVICQEACVDSLIKNSSKIGGEGRNLEVFENKLGRRETDIHLAASEHQVIGVIDVDNGNCFLQLVKTTPRSALLTILRKKVEKGSTLYSTIWEAYDCHNNEQFSRTVKHRKLILKNQSDDCENVFKELHLKAHKHETDVKEFSFDSALCATIYKNSKKSEPFYFVKFLGEIGSLYRDQTRCAKANRQAEASESVPGPSSYQRGIINSFDDMEWSPVINFPCKADVSEQNSFREAQNSTSDDLNVEDNIGPQESNRINHTECAIPQSLEMQTNTSNDCAVAKDGDLLKDSTPEPIPEIHSDASNDMMAVEVNNLPDDSGSGEPSDEDNTAVAGNCLVEEPEESGSIDVMEKTSFSEKFSEHITSNVPEENSNGPGKIINTSRNLSTCTVPDSDCLDLEEGNEKPEVSTISVVSELKPRHLNEMQKLSPKDKDTDDSEHNAMSEETPQNTGKISKTQDTVLEDIVLVEQSSESKNNLTEETVQLLQHSLDVISNTDTDKMEINKTGIQENGSKETGSQEDGNNETGSLQDGSNKTGSFQDRDNKDTKNEESHLEDSPCNSRQHDVIDISMVEKKKADKETTVNTKKLLGPTIDIVNIDDEDSDVEVIVVFMRHMTLLLCFRLSVADGSQ